MRSGEFENSSAEKRLAKNTVLFFAGTIGSKLLTYLLVPFYTSILTTAEYGVCDTIFNIASLLFPIFTLSIGEAVFRYSVDCGYDRSQVFMIGLVFSGIGILCSLLIVPFLLMSEELSQYVIIFIVYYASVIIQTLLSQLAKGCNKLKEYSIAGVITTLVDLVTLIIFLKFLDLGIVGYLLAYILGNFVASIYLCVSCAMWKYYLPVKYISKSHVKDMLRYSIPIIPNAASWWISTSSDKFMLNYFCGYNITGIYSIAYKLPSLMTTVSGIFLNAWQITSAEEYGHNDASLIYSKVYTHFFSFLTVAVSIAIPMTRVAAKILYADEFYLAWKYVPILLLAYIFHDLSAYLGSTYTASKKTRVLFVSTLIGAGLNIVLNFLTIPILGASGAAFSTLVSYFSVWLYRILNSSTIIRIQWDVGKHIFCFSILTIQIWLEAMNNPGATVICAVLALIVCVTNRDLISTIFCTAINFIKRKVRR